MPAAALPAATHRSLPPMTPRWLIGFSLVLSAFAFEAAGRPAVPLEGSVWQLSSLHGQPRVSWRPITAHFDGGRVSGIDGCNHYVATYQTSDSTIEIEMGIGTRMACNRSSMLAADEFIQALTTVRRYRIDGTSLQWLAADGTVLARFVAQPQTLAGTSWTVLTINEGKWATSPPSEAKFSMRFASNGTLSGSTGCNTYHAAYRWDGRSLGISAPTASKRHCPHTARMEQLFFGALASAKTMRIEGDRCYFWTNDGVLALGLSRVATSSGRK